MKRAIALSVIDQGVLSAQSFLFGFLVMRLGDADAVGRYALAMSTYFIVLSVQTALVGTPLMTQVFGRPAEVQLRHPSRRLHVQYPHPVGRGFVTIVLLAAIGFGALEVFAAAAVVASGLLRELSRTVSVSTGNMRRCLSVDATAVVVSFAAVWPVSADRFAGNRLPRQPGDRQRDRNCTIRPAAPHGPAGNPRCALRTYRPHFVKTRWSLLGGAAAVFQARSFFFIVGDSARRRCDRRDRSGSPRDQPGVA